MNLAAIVLSIIALLTTVGLISILLSFLEKEPIKITFIEKPKSYTYSEYELSDQTYATVVDIDE